jgi:hypothetical protein
METELLNAISAAAYAPTTAKLLQRRHAGVAIFPGRRRHSAMTRVLIADDHALFRAGLRQFLVD